MRNRIHAHPFGYKKQFGKDSYRDHPVTRKQVITLKCEYEVTNRDKNGNVIMVPVLNKKGEPTKKLEPSKTKYVNFVKKVINHHDKQYNGKTLAEMVIESYKAKAEN